MQKGWHGVTSGRWVLENTPQDAVATQKNQKMKRENQQNGRNLTTTMSLIFDQIQSFLQPTHMQSINTVNCNNTNNVNIAIRILCHVKIMSSDVQCIHLRIHTLICELFAAESDMIHATSPMQPHTTLCRQGN